MVLHLFERIHRTFDLEYGRETSHIDFGTLHCFVAVFILERILWI